MKTITNKRKQVFGSNLGMYQSRWQNQLDTIDLFTPSITIDPLIDWLPYKWKKYIPAWHILRSYSQ